MSSAWGDAAPSWAIMRTGRDAIGARRLRAMQSHVVGTGIPFAEGPVWCADGTVVATSVAAGALFRVWPDQEKVERFAVTSGGANGAALATDGALLVTQNGGIDFSV